MPLKALSVRRPLPVCGVVLLLALLVPGAAAAQERVMTLDEVVRAAVLRDPAAVAAEVAVANARTDGLQAAGSWLPSLNLNTAYNNSSNERFDQNSGRLVSQSYSTQLQGGWDLFTGGRRLIGRRTAGAVLDAADAQYESQRFNTILSATQAFYDAAAASDIVRVAHQRLERARAQLTAAQTRLELGTATQSDALRAEIEVGNAESAVLDAEASLRSTTLELGRRVGVQGAVTPSAESLPAGAPALPALDVLVQQAAASSPSVIAANATLRSRRAERMASYTNYLPTVRLTGGYDWFAFDFPADQRSWSMRVTASLPVFNGFQREANLQRSAAAERLAEARARDAVNVARVAVESAAAEMSSAERRLAIASRSVLLAQEDLRVQEERYAIGVATILDLQASQVALSDAEVNVVRARHALGTATARLEAILGQRLRGDS
ncbi:MAG TPA: TolC family protein [Longimicrobiales bacterium]|nr:TolC family protein [Longimicrobiales bacterium]